MAQKKYFPIIISPLQVAEKVLSVTIYWLAEMILFIQFLTLQEKPEKMRQMAKIITLLSEEKFNKMLKQNIFAEWAKVHGHLYGTSKEIVENILEKNKHVILDIDTKGARQLMTVFPGSLSIFFSTQYEGTGKKVTSA